MVQKYVNMETLLYFCRGSQNEALTPFQSEAIERVNRMMELGAWAMLKQGIESCGGKKDQQDSLLAVIDAELEARRAHWDEQEIIKLNTMVQLKVFENVDGGRNSYGEALKHQDRLGEPKECKVLLENALNGLMKKAIEKLGKEGVEPQYWIELNESLKQWIEEKHDQKNTFRLEAAKNIQSQSEKNHQEGGTTLRVLDLVNWLTGFIAIDLGESSGYRTMPMAKKQAYLELIEDHGFWQQIEQRLENHQSIQKLLSRRLEQDRKDPKAMLDRNAIESVFQMRQAQELKRAPSWEEVKTVLKKMAQVQYDSSALLRENLGLPETNSNKADRIKKNIKEHTAWFTWALEDTMVNQKKWFQNDEQLYEKIESELLKALHQEHDRKNNKTEELDGQEPVKTIIAATKTRKL